MKKYNLIALGLLGIIYSNKTMTDEKGVPLLPNKAGKVTLTVAPEQEVTISGKKYKAGAKVQYTIDEIFAWVEETDWEEHDVKAAWKERKAELSKLEKEAGRAALEADEDGFVAARNTWKSAKEALEAHEKNAPTKAKKDKEVYVPTPEEAKAIEAYLAKVGEYDAAKTALPKLKEEVSTMKDGLPAGYKTKKTAGTSEGLKINDEIRAKIWKSHLEGVKPATIAKEHKYTSSYVNTMVSSNPRFVKNIAKMKEAYAAAVKAGSITAATVKA